MNIYTIQLSAQSIAIGKGIPVLDITVKSGDPAFAPSWHLVNHVLSNQRSTESVSYYTHHYLEWLETSKLTYPDKWAALRNYDTVALGCYCKPGVFCHRHLLANHIRTYLGHLGDDVNVLGELTR